MVYAVEAVVDINAPQEQVRSILRDFPKWSTWNNFIVKLEPLNGVEELKQGDTIKVIANGAGEFKSIVESNTDSEFSWIGRLFNVDFVFSGLHYFRLEKIDDNTTRFIHGEHFEGFLFTVYRWVKGHESLKASYQDLADGLKKKAEESNQ